MQGHKESDLRAVTPTTEPHDPNSVAGGNTGTLGAQERRCKRFLGKPGRLHGGKDALSFI